VDIVAPIQQTVQCEVLTGSGQTVEDRSGHCEQSQDSVKCYLLREIGETLKAAVDTVTQNQQTVQGKVLTDRG
jgi:flagellar hook-basal body complex protein FliE